MIREKRRLLLKDLFARVPYGVICQFIWSFSNETTNEEDVIANEDDNIRCIDIHTKEIQADYYGEWVDLEHCKPYLRPMSSMTEEERNEWMDITHAQEWLIIGNLDKATDWLNAHHFDYRGLIDRGLALEAKDGMYN